MNDNIKLRRSPDPVMTPENIKLSDCLEGWGDWSVRRGSRSVVAEGLWRAVWWRSCVLAGRWTPSQGVDRSSCALQSGPVPRQAEGEPSGEVFWLVHPPHGKPWRIPGDLGGRQTVEEEQKPGGFLEMSSQKHSSHWLWCGSQQVKALHKKLLEMKIQEFWLQMGR